MSSSVHDTTVLHTSETGPGPAGEQQAQEALEGRTDGAMVGQAAGKNPELIVRARRQESSTTSTATGGEGSSAASSAGSTASGTNWMKKQLAKVQTVASSLSEKVGGNDTDDDDDTKGAAVNITSDDGASNVGNAPSTVQRKRAGSIISFMSSPGRPSKAQEQDAPHPGASVGAGSLASKIQDEMAANPNTSNARFHEKFPMLPEDDQIVEDYRCAISRDILIQGRLYISEQHVSFYSLILGFETSYILPIAEITALTKKNTAGLIKNAIEISTPTTTHLFTSFFNRDAAYDLIARVWEHSHPEEKLITSSADDAASVRSGEKGPQKATVEYTDEKGERKAHAFLPRLVKRLGRSNSGGSSELTPAEKVKRDAQKKATAEGGGHPPTEYDGKEFKDTAMKENYATSPEKIWQLMFLDKELLTKFLEEDQKVLELNLGEWQEDGKHREMDYIKPLNGSIGPKQTHCFIVDDVETADAEQVYVMVTITKTPDVPAGHDFEVQTKTVLRWNEVGGCEAHVTTEVSWSKNNPFLRGVIERSCLDGQKQYHTALDKVMRAHIEANAAEFAVAGAGEAPAKEEEPAGGLWNLPFLRRDVLYPILLVAFTVFCSWAFWMLGVGESTSGPRHVRARRHSHHQHVDQLVAERVNNILAGFRSVAHSPAAHEVGKAQEELRELRGALREVMGKLEGLESRLQGVAMRVQVEDHATEGGLGLQM